MTSSSTGSDNAAPEAGAESGGRTSSASRSGDSAAQGAQGKGSGASRTAGEAGASRTGGAKSSGAGVASADASRTGAGRAAGSAKGARGSASGTAVRGGAGMADRSAAGKAERGASRTPVRSVGKGASVTGTADAAADGTARGTGVRRIRLTLSRIDPLSVMKLSFLIAIAFGIALVVATAVLWGLVDGIGLWAKIDEIGRDFNNGNPLPFMSYFEFSRMISYATIIAVVDIVIITALGTLFALLYNIVAALLGGVKLTFTDD